MWSNECLKVFGVLMAVLAFGGSSAAESDRQVFQVTFGTRPAPEVRTPTTDGGRFLVAATNGDIVVAGHGASTFTDTGNRINPLFARIAPNGHVRWRHIPDDLRDHEVVALMASGDSQYLILKHEPRDYSEARLAPGQRLSLYQLNADGQLSKELGHIDGLYVADVVPYRSHGRAGFLVAALVTEGARYGEAFQRDVSLFDLQLDGTVDRPEFPVGIGGVRHLNRTEDGSLVFLRLKSYFAEPIDVVRVSSDGELESLFGLNSSQRFVMDMIAAGDRLYLFEQAHTGDGKAWVTGYSRNGKRVWETELDELPRFGQAMTEGDGLFVAGSYEGNPVLSKLTYAGERVWNRRFRSARKEAHIAHMAVLDDGWLALTGSTGPGGGAFVSTDHDAFLVVSDPDGTVLEDYDTCMADVSELELLREALKTLAGLEIHRETLMTGRVARSVEELPPLGKPLPRSPDCEGLSEQDLLTFLREAVAEARRLELSPPSDRTEIVVLLRPEGSVPAPGYQEWRPWGAGTKPSMIVASNRAREAMQYIASDILPYTERMHVVNDALRAASTLWVGEASPHEAAGGVPAFKENTRVAERFLELFLALDTDQQGEVRGRLMNKPLIVGADRNVLHLWGDGWLLVGQDSVDEVFTYLLTDLRRLEDRIWGRSQTLLKRLNLRVVKSDPDVLHTEYVDVLEHLVEAANRLSERDVDTIRRIGAEVQVAEGYVTDNYLPGYRRKVYIRPSPEPTVLSFLIAVEAQLQSQEPRRE